MKHNKNIRRKVRFLKYNWVEKVKANGQRARWGSRASHHPQAIQLHQFGPTLWGHETPFDVKRVNFHAQLHRVSLCISRGRVCRARIFPKPRAPSDRPTDTRSAEKCGWADVRTDAANTSRQERSEFICSEVCFFSRPAVSCQTHIPFLRFVSRRGIAPRRERRTENEKRERNAIEMRRFPKALTHPAPVNIGRRSQRACVKFIWNFRGFRLFHSLQTLYAVENYHSTLQIILYA